jgi:probable addiction module antidote protein
MGNRSESYREYLLKRLKDPKERVGYINAALEDGDPKILLAVLEDCAEAMGGVAWLAKQTHLSRPAIYKIISDKGNPRWDSLAKVLSAFHLRINVTLSKKKHLAHA